MRNKVVGCGSFFTLFSFFLVIVFASCDIFGGASASVNSMGGGRVTTAPVSVAEPETDPIAPIAVPGEVTFPDAGSEFGTLSFTIRGNLAAEMRLAGARSVGRSVSGVSLDDFAAHTVPFDVYEVVSVRDSAPGRVFDFDSDRESVNGGFTLTVRTLRNENFHVMLLAGIKDKTAPDTKPPTLLAAGYVTFYADATVPDKPVSITLAPIIADISFINNRVINEVDTREVGRLAKTVGLDKNGDFDLRFAVAAVDEPVANVRYYLRHGAGNGLTPLLEAERSAMVNDIIVRPTFAAKRLLSVVGGASPSISEGTVGNPIRTEGNAYYFPVPETVTNDISIGATASLQPHLVYAPFGMVNTNAWSDFPVFTDSRGAPAADANVDGTTIPVWLIRNGVDDEPQDTTDVANTAKHGAVVVGIVDPAHPYAGLFEDNNPWPIGGPVDTDPTAAAQKDGLFHSLQFLDEQLVAEGNPLGASGGDPLGTGRGRYGNYWVTTQAVNPITFDTASDYGSSRKLGNIKKLTLKGKDRADAGGSRTSLYLAAQGSLINMAAGANVAVSIENVNLVGWNDYANHEVIAANTVWVGSNAPAITIPSSHPAYNNPYNTGRERNNTSLVFVGAGNVFEMKNHSKVTGNYGGYDYSGRHSGGGVFLFGEGVPDSAQLIMSGDDAEISYNRSTDGWGGGFYGYNGATVIISGDNARVDYNVGAVAGGCIDSANCRFVMSGSHSSVSYNQGLGDAGGGGLQVWGGNAELTGSSARIIGNWTVSSGGGVFLYGTSAVFTMTGGEISGNMAATAGGGVWLASAYAVFNMKGGVIRGNCSGDAFGPAGGGGVKTDVGEQTGAGTFQMSGGVVYGAVGTAWKGGALVSPTDANVSSTNTSASLSGWVLFGTFDSAGNFTQASVGYVGNAEYSVALASGGNETLWVGASNPEPPLINSADLAVKFGISPTPNATRNPADVTATINAIHNYIQNKTRQQIFDGPDGAGGSPGIQPGDYLDLPAFSVPAYTSGGTQIAAAQGVSAVPLTSVSGATYGSIYYPQDGACNWDSTKQNAAGADGASDPSKDALGVAKGPLTRIIVVGINSYTGVNGNSGNHIVFQFKNTPLEAKMEATSTNQNGYLGSAMRGYLRDAVQPALRSAGIPFSTGSITTDTIWAPLRKVANKGSGATGVDTIIDELWLPTEYEMFGSATAGDMFTKGNNVVGGPYAVTGQENAANQAALEFYTTPADPGIYYNRRNNKRIKYNALGDNAAYWIASPSDYQSSTQYFCYVNFAGGTMAIVTNGAINPMGIAPAFCVK